MLAAGDGELAAMKTFGSEAACPVRIVQDIHRGLAAIDQVQRRIASHVDGREPTKDQVDVGNIQI